MQEGDNMQCTFCGKENRDGAQFCEFCGSALAASGAGEPAKEAEEIKMERNEEEPEIIIEEEDIVFEEEKKENKNEKAAEKVTGEVVDDESGAEKGREGREAKNRMNPSYLLMDTSRGALGSVFLFLGTLAAAAQVVLMIFYTFSARVYEVMSYLLYFVPAVPNLLLYIRIAVVIIAGLEIIMIIGFMTTWLSALNKKRTFNTAGLTILQVICAIVLIIICFGFLCLIGAALVAARYFMVLYAVSLDSLTLQSILLPACLAAAVIAVFVLIILFVSKLISSLGSVKKAVEDGIIRKNISLYSAVILIAIAVCIVALAVSSLFTIVPSSLYIILGELCLALACVLIAVFMIKYRKKMKRFLQ